MKKHMSRFRVNGFGLLLVVSMSLLPYAATAAFSNSSAQFSPIGEPQILGESARGVLSQDSFAGSPVATAGMMQTQRPRPSFGLDVPILMAGTALLYNTEPVTPGVSVDIYGPDVGPSTIGQKPVRLAPLAIPSQTAAANASLVSDDFNECGLNTHLWTFINPLGDGSYALAGTFTPDADLEISVPANTPHDIWTGGNFAPRVAQPISNTDFEIETKFDAPVSELYQMEGVFVEQDSSNFIRSEFYSTVTETKMIAVSFYPGVSGPLSYTVWYKESITDTNVAPLYMRLSRSGDNWTQAYSFEGTGWIQTVAFSTELTTTVAGTYASNAGFDPPAYTGKIDYFFNTASPINPEDGARNTLTLATIGSGSVVSHPVSSNYSCGDVVTLTATADPGWAFSDWSGALVSTTNPITTAMVGAKTITATFSQSEYTLQVHATTGGSVTKDPDQLTYDHGDVVTLTASADSGWVFGSWSGNLSGVTNPITITMDASKVVTATFLSNQLTLYVGVVGDGSVTKQPNKTVYAWGEGVTLTALADPGWVFKKWLGDVISTSNPVSLTMGPSKIVTATFNSRVFLPIIVRAHQ